MFELNKVVLELNHPQKVHNKQSINERNESRGAAFVFLVLVEEFLQVVLFYSAYRIPYLIRLWKKRESTNAYATKQKGLPMNIIEPTE